MTSTPKTSLSPMFPIVVNTTTMHLAGQTQQPGVILNSCALPAITPSPHQHILVPNTWSEPSSPPLGLGRSPLTWSPCCHLGLPTLLPISSQNNLLKI